MSRLNNVVVVVTRATEPLGEAQVRRFAAEGAHVVVLTTDERAGSALADSVSESGVGESGGGTIVLVLDCADEAGWAPAVDTVIDRLGRVDVLVNNPAVSDAPLLEEIDASTWKHTLDASARAAFFGVRAVLPHMTSRGTGSIINVTSVSGMAAPQGSAEADAAVAGALRIMAKDVTQGYSPEGVRCNSIHVGLVDDRWAGTVALEDDERDRILALTPLRRSGTVDDVANCALFLASEEAAFVTGTELVVDGGFLAT